MRHNPLPDDYKDTLDSINDIRLVIMGKDPYPTDAVGIPFCKPTWKSMCDRRISGLYVLESLGADVERVRQDFDAPRDYFMYLAKEKGIVFLNLSYHFLNGPIKKSHALQLQCAEEVNKQYLLKSPLTVLCGEAKKIDWYQGTYPNLHYAAHPDLRCKISHNKSVSDSWKRWWSKDALHTLIK